MPSRGAAGAAAALALVLPRVCAAAGPTDQSSPDECWTFGGGDQHGITAATCCHPAPCGNSGCWTGFEFSYHFCCEKPGCTPRSIGGVRVALRAARRSAQSSLRPLARLAALDRGLNGSSWGKRSGTTSQIAKHLANASRAGQLLAPRSFSRLLTVRLEGPGQDCECAVATAAAAVLRTASATASAGAAQAASALSWRLSSEWLTQPSVWTAMLEGDWTDLLWWLAHLPFTAAWLHAEPPLPLEPRRVAAFLRRGPWRHVRDFAASARAHAAETTAAMSAAGGLGAPLSELVSALAADGALGALWRHVEADERRRSRGVRCAAAPSGPGGQKGRWTSCQPWEYSPIADFSSPDPHAGAKPGARAAVCVLGAPRSLLNTYDSIRRHVIQVLHADAFLYMPYNKVLTLQGEDGLPDIGPIVTAVAVPDASALEFERRFRAELVFPGMADNVYAMVPGPWRAPLFGEMGSSMWAYFHQEVCQRMVTSHERQRGRAYDWVVFARADMLWSLSHPSLHALDPSFVHIPFGQDNNFYAGGKEPGLNDRHAVVPRHLVAGYFGRWQALCDGSAIPMYITKIYESMELINTEQYLLLHLRAVGVPVRRFPPAAFIIQCQEGPQCKHLYKGTDIRKRKWTSTFKYMTELIEVQRTVSDGLRGSRAGKWTWILERPHAALAPEASSPWEILSLAYACCATESGPVSCSRLWAFTGRCQSFPTARGRAELEAASAMGRDHQRQLPPG